MKLTKNQLRKIIKEEIEEVLDLQTMVSNLGPEGIIEFLTNADQDLPGLRDTFTKWYDQLIKS